MAEALFSLAVITVIAFLCPFLASLIPGRWVPSSALVLLAGALVGPHALGLVNPTAPGIPLLRSLGLAFIFLMGGYELSPQAIFGRTGRHAQASWAISFLLALVASFCIGHFAAPLMGLAATGGAGGADPSVAASFANAEVSATATASAVWSQTTIVAFAIALSSTSYGKVEADMKTRNLLHTRFARVITSYGATGELLPVVATAILLGTGAPAVELAIMAFFVLVALGVSRITDIEKAKKTRLQRFIEASDKAPQLLMQLVVALTVALVALGVILGADMIVSGFAAGYILKRLLPQQEATKSVADVTTSKALSMLRGIAYGFFIPIAFVLAGCNVDIVGGAQEPLVIALFIVLLLLVRGLPVFAGVTLFPVGSPLPFKERIAVALYSCTTLSTVVAMTGVAVEAGDMTSGIASALVFAAALVTFVIPVAERLIDPAEKIRGYESGA